VKRISYITCFLQAPSISLTRIRELDLLVALGAFIGVLIVLILAYRIIFAFLRRRIIKLRGTDAGVSFDLFRIPPLLILSWILLNTFTHMALKGSQIFGAAVHFNNILLIVSITWLLTRVTEAGYIFMQGKLDIKKADNLNARKSLTKINLFKGILNFLIIFIGLAVCLLTFRQARSLGISLLTSAGIAGIIVGFAAQKSIGLILAGVQLAITQPVRLDDVVIVEGEWGRVEEISLTFVVIRIWDERRLILPSTWFLEKPFQNWTLNNADIIGSVFLYVDYMFPVESLRKILPGLLKDNSDWDGRIWNVQVTNTTERTKEIRILLSSSDSSKNWDLRTFVREQLIDFINFNFPDAFVKIRIAGTIACQ
jgi:small-conductance mechanosensitive channel